MGTAVAAAFAHALGLGFAFFGVLVVVGTAVFLLLNKEPAASAPEGEPFRWEDLPSPDSGSVPANTPTSPGRSSVASC
ncbi:hypothetical protein [Streptomyces sp. KL116D]|uniref:hypothetical protein n=1 Tax=Streptomyces sp. KL116D TaxID=3045152 RepID=UPI003557547C